MRPSDRRECGLAAVLDVDPTQPVAQTRLHDPEVGGDMFQRLPDLAVAGHPDDVLTELLRKWLRHGEHRSSGASQRHRSDATHPCSSPV
jgi:hypothetical protein